MSDTINKIQEFVDSISASVALVGRDASGQLVFSACNEQFFEMTGGHRVTMKGAPIPFDAIIPNYARHSFHDKVIECFNSGIPQELEQAYDLRDGTHWWRLSLKPFQHTYCKSDVVEILITGLDITPKMLLTHDLEVSTSRFRAVVDAAYDAIITMDQQHRVTLFNHAAENLFGYASSEVLGQPIEMLLPEKFRANHGNYVRQFARSPVNSRQMDERNRVYGQHRDGTQLPVEIAISKINVDGLIEFTAIIHDISDHVRLMDLLQKQAITDELTGLPNRREFMDVVENILATDEELSVFILDVDHFKHINDNYGHDIGDEVLRILAKVSTDKCRGRDLFARWGGEEFVAVLPGTGPAKAREIADRLRGMFERQEFDHTWRLGKPIPFTVSIGVATRSHGEKDLDTLMKRADQALYKAKESGRNRVEQG
jgi:diguanylate cyclase (GGDEF)-like protein/PAS domain S-box-containing protein